ncbi:MAG: pantoate--beta-alanine ligase [Bacteriovoracaceae bacterium]|nr:pantoate--beta-alanine ligase [Bacteriovoracaceae bacterium]
MKLFTKKSDYQHYNLGQNRLGLVPTMGNLHQGHLNLVTESLKENDKTLVTIFVNPKQFGPNEDFSKYPRTLEDDLSALKGLTNSENILVFAPESTQEIYPPGFNTEISVHGLDQTMCGEHRPGHFQGVTTVVYQLFVTSKAHVAYFGQKDYQQFKIIEKMVKDLQLPISLKMVPIAREPSGLALSSRNQYLSNQQKNEAIILFNTLNELAKTYLKDPSESESLRQKYLMSSRSWQYLEIRDAETLRIPDKNTFKVVVAGAYFMGDTRLIDNVILKVRD